MADASEKTMTKHQLLHDLMGVFGTVKLDNITDAVYILPNGKLMDTRGPYTCSQHDNIPKYIEARYGFDDTAPESGSKFMNSVGAIRVTPWIPGIVIPRRPMTSDQEKSLYDVIRFLSPRISTDKPLMVLSEDGLQFIEYISIGNPEDIITNIMGYQAFGLLREEFDAGVNINDIRFYD